MLHNTQNAFVEQPFHRNPPLHQRPPQVVTMPARNRDAHYMAQADACELGVINYDFVLRFETLENDLSALVQQLGPRYGATIYGSENTTSSLRQLHSSFQNYSSCRDDSSCVVRTLPGPHLLDGSVSDRVTEAFHLDIQWAKAAASQTGPQTARFEAMQARLLDQTWQHHVSHMRRAYLSADWSEVPRCRDLNLEVRNALGMGSRRTAHLAMWQPSDRSSAFSSQVSHKL